MLDLILETQRRMRRSMRKRYFARAERRSLGENPVELFNQSLDEIARRKLAPEAAYAQGEIYNQDRAFQTEILFRKL